MLVHLVADYGVGDLAAAEVRASLAVHLPGADVAYTPVGPFDTVAAGFCIAQLALGEGPPERLVYHNVAPRQDRDDPRHVVARLPAGEAAAEEQVVDVVRVESRNLLERRLHDLHGQVVGSEVLEGPLVRSTDRRASGRDDDGLGHCGSPSRTAVGPA